MKVVQQTCYGVARDSVACVEADDLPPPTGSDVTIEIDASPIHPADLLTLTGGYAARPALPVVPGGEASARVVAVGPAATSVEVGDRVIPISRGNWVQRRTVAERDLIKVPDGDPLQLAMLKVVPATAYLMLTRIVDLGAGDLCIQNAANSSVGLAVIRLAPRLGADTINVVRRPELVDELVRYGAGRVLVDGPDLAGRVRAAAGDRPVRLGIDAVAGEASLRLSECLAPGATMISYGMLSGEPCMIRPARMVFEAITLTGFWLTKHLTTTPRAEIDKLYETLVPLVLDGTVSAPIEATYPIEEVAAAVEHAARFRRRGKIMITPNGRI